MEFDKQTDPGGSKANRSGRNLEDYVYWRLGKQNYQQVGAGKDFPQRCQQHAQPLFARQCPLGLTIYQTPHIYDFIVYHPQKWPAMLLIECKWQQSAGSVDEKFPYLVENARLAAGQHYLSGPGPTTLVLLDGKGYRPGAEKWLRQQQDSSFLLVCNMAELMDISKQGLI